MSDSPATENTKFDTISVLIVEDDDVNALLLQKMLSGGRHGSYRFRRADSLSAALREVAQGGIDLVILDLGLPDSQGFDTFVRMRAGAEGVPIVVLSGLDDEELAIATVQQGAQDYLVKGEVDGASLARAIRYAIERCRVQQALVKEHDLLRSVMENIPDQVYLKDTDSRFVSVNPVTARFFGASSPDRIVGKCDSDFFPRELATQFLAEERELLHHNQPCVNREAAITDSAGNTQWILTTKVPLRDHTGNITGLLGINRDITDRKRAEHDLKEHQEHLEALVRARTSDLMRAHERLEAHDKARSEFVSSVSHELRTPLSSMKFEITNLLEGVVGPVPEPVADYLHMLDTDCQRMISTVDDILDLSRLESQTMRLHRAKLLFDRLIQRAATALKTQAQIKSIGIVLSLGSGSGFVECDALKTLRAIINLIGNAIKFTPDGGRVEIGLHKDTAPGALVMEITDNGIGIAPQHLPRVTDKYFRVGEHVSGIGLGLPLAKEIVELHGGRLAIQSPPPGRACGTRVTVSIPTAASPTVLIANADEARRRSLEQQLRAYGYHVIACATHDEAIDLTRGHQPDVGILDVPASDRGEVPLVYRMKADRHLRSMPLVAVAGASVDRATQEVLNGLSIPLLPTPWREEELLDRIETAIAKGGSASDVPKA